ncbi:hypothetical protein AB0383_20470 [Amycolatopsis sp. NPDC051373]|uniref:hypothetical protein n=1 Tax=Amycolatopsis sp. NPDC051373 TaxID=3155801 RepID=UPI00344E27EF
MTAATSLRNKAQRLVQAQSTQTLITSLTALGPQIDEARETAQRTKNYDDAQALNLTRSWVVNELENRHPEASAAVEQAFIDAETDEDMLALDYDMLLIAAIVKAQR